ncbi:MAG: anti-sigma factor domain-containing protein [Clostridium sp.]|nr:anti-sigma factor domain-containing protein [Clostridium sp.]
MKLKGTVLKLKKNLAIIMTNECRIVSIKRKPGMYEGLELTFNKNEIINKKSKLAVSIRIAAAVAAIFIIMLVLYNPFNSSGAYAYIAIDSDASIEFELDKNNKILKINYFNDDANVLLKELDLKNKSVDFAIKEVIKRLNQDESTILISACLKEKSRIKSGVSEKIKPDEFNKLMDICKNAVETNVIENVHLKVVEVPYDYKKLADTNKISIGRSVLYEKAREQGIDFGIEDIKNKSVGETLKKVKIDDDVALQNGKKDKPVKPAPKPESKESKKDKPISEEKVESKPVAEPKDKPQDKTKPEPKNKPEEKPTAEPKGPAEGKAEPTPKGNPEEKPKDNVEVKPGAELKDVTKPTPKDSIDTETGPEHKDGPKDSPKSNPDAKPEAELKEIPNENLKDNLGVKPEVEIKDSPKENPKDNPEGKPEVEIKGSPNENPKDIPEGKPEVEIKNSPKENPKDNPEIEPEVEIEDSHKETLPKDKAET